MMNEAIKSLEAALEAAQREVLALRNAQAERDRFFALALDVMVVCTADGLLERVNPAFSAVLGYDPAEVTGTSLLSLLHPDDQDSTRVELGKLAERRPVFRFENRYRHRLGHYRLLEWNAVFEDERVYASARDITERRELERENEKRRLQMEEAQRLAHVGSFELDLQTGVSYWSDEMYRIFDLPIGSAVPFELVLSRTHPDDRPAAERVMAEGRNGQRDEVDFEHRVIRQDGTERRFHLKGVFVRDEAGRAVRFIGSGQDVTTQHEVESQMARHVEALEQANAHKDQFLGILSHELRTPLNAIQGFGSILEDGLAGRLTESQAEFVNRILTSSEDLLALVNDLLDMSRMQAGKFVLEPREVAIAPLLLKTLACLEPCVTQAGHAFHHDVPADLPPLVADPQRLSQIVSNLVGNAVKYTPVGGAIRVTARPEGAHVRVAVADNGIGIPPEARERIFEPFTQVDMSDTRPQSGVGLGLSIVKALVAAHGGEIGVTSEPGQGSTFWFTLPVRGA